MKKFIALLMSILFCLAIAGCSSNSSSTPEEPESQESESVVPVKEPDAEFRVSVEDGYDQAGFTEHACENDATVVFVANEASEAAGIVWKVYILDEAFDDGFRYIPQAYEAAGEGNCSVDVTAGQYLYIECSENGFSVDRDAITADAGYEASIYNK